MQSGESEPLDLGLPISNLDGLRVVLDVAEHSPGKGEEHIHTHTLSCKYQMWKLSHFLFLLHVYLYAGVVQQTNRK